jgi:uncharacterized protein HemY
MLETCFAKIRLARATELAQSKRFLEAEAILSPKGVLSDDPRELDLLARIAAKQEQFGKARKLWEAALQKSPTTGDYAECLEEVRKLENTSGLTVEVLNWVVWIMVALSIVAIIYALKPLK